MLYDPKWDTKTDQFTLKNLIAWLEKQPADERYVYTDAERCLLGQWVQSIDIEARCCFEGNSFALGRPLGGHVHA